MNRGLIREAKRFNVALTRAKELNIVVGNGSVLKVRFYLLLSCARKIKTSLQVDPWWKQTLIFAMRNSAYLGPPIEGIDPTSVDAFSRLEERWRNMSNGPNGPLTNGIQDDDDGAGITVGSVVRETLVEKD